MMSLRLPRRAVLVPVFLVAGLAAAGAALALRPGGPPTSPFRTDEVPPQPLLAADIPHDFVGSRACAECHPTEAADHARSLHARTIKRVDDPDFVSLFETGKELSDPDLRATYSFRNEGGRPVATVRKPGGETVRLTPSYAIGSGKYGVTPIYSRDGNYMEGRASYYPNLKGWHWTPGQQERSGSRMAEGRPMDRDETIRCFLCHGTAIVQTDGDPIAPQSLLDIGCERCHGPGKEHVEDARKGRRPGSLFTYTRASGPTVMNLCAQCHRRPSETHGADLELDPNLPRFAGTALAASKCYRLSEGKLTCTTCHNPHAPVAEEDATYEAKCLGCHSGSQDQKACPVNPKSGCIPCHMPAQSINFPGGAKFHNHWIKPYPDKLRAAFGGRAARTP